MEYGFTNPTISSVDFERARKPGESRLQATPDMNASSNSNVNLAITLVLE
jgi:hypothetical protein